MEHCAREDMASSRRVRFPVNAKPSQHLFLAGHPPPVPAERGGHDARREHTFLHGMDQYTILSCSCY